MNLIITYMIADINGDVCGRLCATRCNVKIDGVSLDGAIRQLRSEGFRNGDSFVMPGAILDVAPVIQ